MTRRLWLAAAAATVALSGCGEQEAQTLKTAFQKDISSANVTLRFTAMSDQGQGVKLSLAGPYKSNGDAKLPSVDWKVAIAGAMPQPLQARLISTGDNAFVVYEGETYEVGRENIARFEQRGAGQEQPGSPDLQKLMSQMRDWFPETDAREDAELDGEPVTRLTGRLDLSAALKDLQELARQPGSSGFEALTRLNAADLRQIEKSVSDPRFTVDVARSDGKLRRIVASLRVKQQGETGKVAFSLQFKDVDKPVTIDAPDSGKPIQQLGRRLQREFGGAQTQSETTVS